MKTAITPAKRHYSVMVFYMLNKIADCAENVVRNFALRDHFPEAMLRICPGYWPVPIVATVNTVRR
ncbi:TPA: hypothetical protein JD834_01680 [Klebsiella oxytoca]|nr:hypothetical protein [Klebsiella oxytoca]MBZ7545902.1 hypothetical protein [Klebsiella oxytoca]MBZ7738049.1 hypothetical protein [Klebsiella oxytoca]MBZ7909845.1 hypothetical protein [Klebsiella oxytoca]HAU6238923.1 hypothetical protein [Klebsiella oxytoca]